MNKITGELKILKQGEDPQIDRLIADSKKAEKEEEWQKKLPELTLKWVIVGTIVATLTLVVMLLARE